MFSKFAHWVRVIKAGSDAEQFATQQVEYLGKNSDAFMVFPYGVHGNVPSDSLGLNITTNCNPENKAVIAWTPKIRPKLEDGEVAFYHPPSGSTIIWKKGGFLEITTEADVTVNCNNLTANTSGNTTINTTTFTINGNFVCNGTMTNNGQDVGNTHGHAQGPDSNGDSEAPISGVT